MIVALFPKRSNSHLSFDCLFVILRITRASNAASEHPCGLVCTNASECTKLLQTIDCPSPFFFFPAYPVVHGHVRFVFTTNITDFTGDTLFTPYPICFDSKLCNLFVNSTVSYNGSTCHYYSDLDVSNNTFEKWLDLVNSVNELFLRCSSVTNNDCTDLFQCKKSTRCIS